jgi:hypothetical protein
MDNALVTHSLCLRRNSKFIKIFVTQQEKVVMATLNCCMAFMKVLHNKLRATPVFTSSLLVELRRREI